MWGIWPDRRRGPVVDLQLDGLIVDRQGDDDRAAARREADGVLQHALQDGFEHALAGAHDGALIEAADQPASLVARISRKCKRGVADELGKISRQARRLDQLGGADVVPLGGDHQVEQALQRGVDDLEGALGPRIVERHGAPHRLEAERMVASGVLKECLVLGVLPDLLGDAPQVVHQLVEVACDARQLGHDVAVAEGVVADAALADLGGDVAEAAQAEAMLTATSRAMTASTR